MEYQIIEKVVGREILDSRGNPTVEAEVTRRSHWRTAPSGEGPLRAALPPANSKRWNSGTGTEAGSEARA